ncbi:DNA cytosine methyltransferase [Stenotrophomonas panacihumi]|uniref:DNA cytosine methyltransferase n=1 Tax=Stenotrophomonas panacihumi TaxID=676599 RepID=UPI0009D6AF6E|nr:DNA cytosine methyltransferase [Stenotrophomonas panacihumi]PTN53767.1 DNA cytosine methyltransferase [Stenotrophomonas panacihumi]
MRHIETSREMPSAVDLFSGCGGLSLGLRQAGYRVLAAVEVDPKAQETYRLNHPDVQLCATDIRQLDPVLLRDQLGLGVGDLKLLAGCPPCQGFSRLRTRNKFASIEDPRNNLVIEFQRFAEAFRPQNILLENVPSLRGDARFRSFVATLESMGYKCLVEVIDAADYGVPQRRRRLIMLASLLELPSLPEPVAERSTVRKALSDVREPGDVDDPLHSIPENRSEAVRRIIGLIPKDGGSRRDLPDHLILDCHKKSSGFNDVYGRMAWDKVAPAITSGCHNPSKGRFLHPESNRTITLREAALLQGFPLDYKFVVGHGKESIALMIGNALPPPLIAAHAGSFIS